jgi:hypothetical protein
MPSSHRRYADWTVGRIRRDLKLFADHALARGDDHYAPIQRSLGGVQLLIRLERAPWYV